MSAGQTSSQACWSAVQSNVCISRAAHGHRLDTLCCVQVAMDAQRAQQEQQAAGSASSDASPWATALHSLPQPPGDSTVLGPQQRMLTACCKGPWQWAAERHVTLHTAQHCCCLLLGFEPGEGLQACVPRCAGAIGGGGPQGGQLASELAAAPPIAPLDTSGPFTPAPQVQTLHLVTAAIFHI